MQHDAWLFVGIFAFIFVIWIATGGPTHPLAFTGPTLAEPGALGGGSYLSLPRAPFAVGSQNVSLPGSSSGGGSLSSGGATPFRPLEGVDFGAPSPYRGLVSLQHYVSGAGASDPSGEYAELAVSQNAGTSVDITGWAIESVAMEQTVLIPKGTETPASGLVNAVSDIMLLPGEHAFLISGRSPIGGAFRESKCTGYLAQFQKFSPPLPNTCPEPEDEMKNFYPGYLSDSSCVTYAYALPRCSVVLTPPQFLTGSCQSFVVNHLNYNGCVNAHRSDADFLDNAWHVYLGRTTPIFRATHEVVKLLDAQGKTVDAFSY